MKSWQRRFLWLSIGSAAVYGMVCIDVMWRARQAYLEGEKAASPGEAYAWYESAATLFTPPESRWSRLAREKMPQAKSRWKTELEARGMPVADAMFE